MGVNLLGTQPVSAHQQSMILSLYLSSSGADDAHLFEAPPARPPKVKTVYSSDGDWDTPPQNMSLWHKDRAEGIYVPEIPYQPKSRGSQKNLLVLRTLSTIPRLTPSQDYPISQSTFIFPKSHSLFHKNSLSPFPLPN